jgi:Ser/Thr protein kinase RdoA (MazF antagonist)
MRGTIGEKLGEGAYAEVYAWAPGQVLKLFKSGFPQRASWWEARITRAASAAGAAAPAVFDEVTVEDRFGVVLERLDGPTLLQLSRDNSVTRDKTGAILATLAISVHRRPPPPEAPLLSVSLADQLQRATGRLPEPIAAGVLALIERLPAQDGFCHGDLHPANVIMTAAGPRLIDWGGATRAPVGLDLACCHVVLSQLAPETADDPERPRAVNAAFQAEYARLAGTSPAALRAAIAPYLAIARVRALVGPVGSPAVREQLIRQVEATLHAS